jgi:hypothetical protein
MSKRKEHWVEVRDNGNTDWCRRLFIADVGGNEPFCCVHSCHSQNYISGESYDTQHWEQCARYPNPNGDQ